MYKSISLEIFVENTWSDLGEVEILESQVNDGYKAKGNFQYDLEYLDKHESQLFTNGIYAASVRYPLNFGYISEESWPAFLLDLLPTGAARINWLRRLDLKDGPTADFELLAKGAINPPGNIRVKFEGDLFSKLGNHPGFDYKEVTGRGVDFIEYAENLGAVVSGTSGAQGVAPKFLLSEDVLGNWHGDGAIADKTVKKNWLVKFPRGKKKRDYQILKSEGIYYEVARDLGIKVCGPLKWDNDTLFIPRFDREKDKNGNLIRKGLESLISAMGISEYGVSKKNEDYLTVLHKYCSDPSRDIKEFVFRDFLNVIMGNTDNHGRNTALLKSENKIEISPLFDFAPMVLDDTGIPRATKWKNETSHIPNFQSIHQALRSVDLSEDEIILFLKESFEKLEGIRERLKNKGMEEDILDFVTRKYDDFMTHYQTYLSSL
ncbi:MAG: type II toxin-antitoxin system HipA family toxin [Bdellovibrionaceae bacterium]|jgi:serine/threonine-protein kinase HipA|nr:type II toxin-antitoxin system HipA family toxin [Pseudobdellovibrionaceae bacterium]